MKMRLPKKEEGEKRKRMGRGDMGEEKGERRRKENGKEPTRGSPSLP